MVRTAATLCAVVLISSACADRKGLEDPRRIAAIQRIAAARPAWIVTHDAVGATLWNTERAFYHSRGNRPAWLDGGRATPQLEALIEALRRSDVHGLDPDRDGLADVRKTIESATSAGGRVDPARAAEIDTTLTYAYLRYAADLLGWSATPAAIDAQWIVARKTNDLAARLTAAIAANQVRQTLDELAPTHPQYKGLQAALAGERTHPTGHLDRIRMNLERWRWMPRDLGDRYILVNVAAYQMQVMEGDTSALAMRVIVGEPDHPTPLFNDEMTYVVFSPTWVIPESIIRNEMVPHLVNDRSYLERHDIEVVRNTGRRATVVDPASVDWTDEQAVDGLRFRQAPGPENALGLVKFIFPNAFDVYLHDTPATALFNRAHRALSHGCVRVENPVGLARYVLRDQPAWTTTRITEAMEARREQTVPLKERLPVHIGYWTVWVNPGGSVTYTDDPYGLDRKQADVEHASLHSRPPGKMEPS